MCATPAAHSGRIPDWRLCKHALTVPQRLQLQIGVLQQYMCVLCPTFLELSCHITSLLTCCCAAVAAFAVQLGTCSIGLQGLLRQGQELSELLLEVPLLQASSSSPNTSAAGAAADTAALLDTAAAAAAAQFGVGGQQQMQLGHLVVRLINIGREPSNSSARVQGFDAAEAAAEPGTPGKKVSRGSGLGSV